MTAWSPAAMTKEDAARIIPQPILCSGLQHEKQGNKKSLEMYT